MTGAKQFLRVLTAPAAALLMLAANTVRADATAYPEQGDSRPGGLAMAADVVLGRPLGLVGSVIGTAVFVVGLPFEAASGDISGPGRRLVVEPLKFTFTRPLGEFR